MCDSKIPPIPFGGLPPPKERVSGVYRYENKTLTPELRVPESSSSCAAVSSTPAADHPSETKKKQQEMGMSHELVEKLEEQAKELKNQVQGCSG